VGDAVRGLDIDILFRNHCARELIAREMEELPDPALEEILDFVRFLRVKSAREVPDTAVASEPVLAKEWLRPEEDRAWQDL
ncbi:MAG: hypothetical protein AAB225_21390, partial [Acidobacteriota bacterium]